MKILVTGANGYLGQGVVKALLDNGHSVVAADFKTNYVDVVNYDFYREENIYVYDGHFDLKAPFFNSDYLSQQKAISKRRMKSKLRR